MDDIIAESTPGEKTKGGVRQREKPGDFDTANEDFDRLGPSDVGEIRNGGRKGVLPDGSKVNVRPNSGSGGEGPPTLEIQTPKGRPIKVRYR